MHDPRDETDRLVKGIAIGLLLSALLWTGIIAAALRWLT